MLNRGQISAIDHLNPSPLTAVSSIYQFPLDYCPDRTSNNSEIVITELDFLNLLCKSRYFRRGNHNTAKTVKGRDFPDSQNGHFHFEHPRSAVQNTETTINYVLASNEFYLTNRSPCVLQLRVGGGDVKPILQKKCCEFVKAFWHNIEMKTLFKDRIVATDALTRF